MFSKRNVTLSAKIGLCAMLMLLTAGVASASQSSDFSFTAIGTQLAAGGSTDNLALELVIPDAYNNGPGAEDTVIYDNGVNDSFNGDALTIFQPNEKFLDADTNTVYTTGPNIEAIVDDANLDGILEANPAGDSVLLEGKAPWSNFSLAGPNAEFWFDSTMAPDAGEYDGVEAIWNDGDGSSAAPPIVTAGDSVIIGGLSSVVNFNSGAIPNAIPAAGPPSFVLFADGAGPCDNGNGAYDLGEPIWVDIIPDGAYTFGLGADTIIFDGGACFNAIGYPLYPGTPFGLNPGGPIPGVDTVAFLDSNHNGIYDLNPDDGTWGPPPFYGEPIVNVDPMTVGAVVTDNGNLLGGEHIIMPYATMTPGDAGIAGVYVEDADLMSNDDNYYLETVAGPAGFTGDESVIDDDDANGLLSDGEVVVSGLAPTANLSTGWVFEQYTGGPGFDSVNDDIYDSADAVLDRKADGFDGITLMNNGTLPLTYIAAVNVWADGGNGNFEAGGDDVLLGTAAWDGADSWQLPLGSYLVPALGLEVYVSVDLNSPVPDNSTIELYVPQCDDDGNLGCGAGNGVPDPGDEGVWMASGNNGPTDGIAIPATTNRLLTPDTSGGGGGGGGGGSGGGSTSDCGDGTKDTGEECDDGNKTSGDGCDRNCDLETGYVWDPAAEEVVLESEYTPAEETTEEEGDETTKAGEGTLEEPTDLTDDEVAFNFSDYDAAFWAASYIAKLFNSGVMTGMGDGTFGVAVGTTRAEIVKIALLANGIEVPESVDEAPFKDTPLGEWFTPYVAKAVELGIVEGYDDGNFRPGNMVNRAEALKILLLAKGVDLDGYDLSSLTALSDVSETIWYAVYVAYALDNGIVTGYDDGTFKAIQDILRGEIAKIAVLIMEMGMEIDMANIAELVVATNDLSTLLAALQAGELVPVFEDESAQYTVFAPTNAAFADIQSTVDTLLLPENQADLQDVLKYHVVSGVAMSSDLSDGQMITTLQGDNLEVEITDGNVYINDAMVTTADIEASNGVVHIVDTVLVP